MYNTTFTSASHLSLSWTRFIQSMPPHPTCWRSILLLSSHLCQDLPSGFNPSGLPTKRLYTYLLSPIHATCTSHLILDLVTYLLSCTDHETYSKVCIKVLPIVIKHMCLCDHSSFLVMVFCRFFNLGDAFFYIFLLFGVSRLLAQPSISQKILPIII